MTCSAIGCENEAKYRCANESNCLNMFCSHEEMVKCEACYDWFCEDCINTEPISGAQVCGQACAQEWWEEALFQAADKVIRFDNDATLKDLLDLRASYRNFLILSKAAFTHAKAQAMKEVRQEVGAER